MLGYIRQGSDGVDGLQSILRQNGRQEEDKVIARAGTAGVVLERLHGPEGERQLRNGVEYLRVRDLVRLVQDGQTQQVVGRGLIPGLALGRRVKLAVAAVHQLMEPGHNDHDLAIGEGALGIEGGGGLAVHQAGFIAGLDRGVTPGSPGVGKGRGIGPCLRNQTSGVVGGSGCRQGKGQGQRHQQGQQAGPFHENTSKI